MLVSLVMAVACTRERTLAEDHGFEAMSKWGRPSDEWVWRCVIDTLTEHPDRLPTADKGFELAPPEEPAQFAARSAQSFLIRLPRCSASEFMSQMLGEIPHRWEGPRTHRRWRSWHKSRERRRAAGGGI